MCVCDDDHVRVGQLRGNSHVSLSLRDTDRCVLQFGEDVLAASGKVLGTVPVHLLN